MTGNTKSGRVSKKEAAGKKKAEEVEFDNTLPARLESVPRCPGKLKGKARKYWKTITPTLVDRGILADVDIFALERLAMLYGEWCKLEEKILKDGITYETETDRGAYVARERPEAKLLINVNKEIRDLEKRFGLTPFDREGVKSAKVKKSISVRDKY